MEEPGPVHFRVVIEMSFPDADPWDPTDYDQLFVQWKDAMEHNLTFNCKDVSIREITTIGKRDDYEDWRHGRGEYDLSARARREGIRQIRGLS